MRIASRSQLMGMKKNQTKTTRNTQNGKSEETLKVRFSGQPQVNAMESMTQDERKAVQQYGKAYRQFLQQSVCSSWTAKTILESALKEGFKPYPIDGSRLKPGGKYYFNNNDESVALVVIGKENPATTGFNIVGSHLDSPQLELKPNTLNEQNQVAELKTKYRGGGTWLTWFNRPLGIAGKVYETVLDNDGRPKLHSQTHLPMQNVRHVRIDSPSIVIPIEAIHFNRKLNEGREINKETDLNPIAAISKLNGNEIQASIQDNVIEILKKHHIDLSKADRAELFLFPTDPPQEVGYDKSMILAQGHDDRSMCFAAMQALMEAANKSEPPAKTSIAYFFDNEETGSLDRGSATSKWVENVASDVIHSTTEDSMMTYSQILQSAFSKSLIISADVAHGVMPAHTKYFDMQNAPYLGQGPAIKVDSSGHYATTPLGTATIKDICERAKIPYQVMSTRQDVSCGTTIGPMIAARTNALTVDIGAPITSMHSCQEMGATVDFYLTKELFRHFFLND